MVREWVDPASHLTPEFAANFPTWQRFWDYLDRHAAPPEVSTDRIVHQVLAADFAQRLAAVEPHDWVLLGSMSLPGRPDSMTWPTATASASLDPAHVVARAAFDLDMSARDLDDPDPQRAGALYGATVRGLISQVAAVDPDPGNVQGLGLGGLVRYSIAHHKVRPDGTNMGIVLAQPRETHLGPESTVVADDPISLEFDLKPPVKVGFVGPAQQSLRPLVAITIPGMAPYTPSLLPTHHQLAAKICILTGPPASSRDHGPGPWHRYKDLFDCYYMIRNCRLDAQEMRSAIRSNQNLARFGVTDLPDPYRLYPGEPGEDRRIPWRAGIARLRATHPELDSYPSFDEMVGTIADFVAGLRRAGPAAVWENQRWMDRESTRANAEDESVAIKVTNQMTEAVGPEAISEGLSAAVSAGWGELSGANPGEGISESGSAGAEEGVGMEAPADPGLDV